MAVPEDTTCYETGGLRIDAAQRVVLSGDGTRVPLSSRAFDLLLFFVRHPGELHDKNRLMKAVWPNTFVEENNLNQCIGALRRLFGESPGEHRFLVTESGRGYRFVAEVRPVTVGAPLAGGAPPAVARRSQWPWWSLAAAVAVAAAVTVAVARYRRSAPIDRSIAVLPFENRSEVADNAYLARGIQEEILTLLSRVGELHVSARGSTERYVGRDVAPGQIARDLHVGYLLEGSVQRSGDTVRIQVQLTDANADRTLWAETYERHLEDVFTVESEVAQAIARELATRLSTEERASLASAPTRVPAAYDAYLRARAYAERITRTEAEIRDAIAAYGEAVRLDPEFALAWAQLSRRHANLFSLSYDRSDARRQAAEAALQEAVRLAPDRIETQLAQGYFLLRVAGDFTAAEKLFRDVAARAPQNADPSGGLAQLAREQRRLQESVSQTQAVLAKDPQNPYLHGVVCEAYLAAREFELAMKTCDRALDLLPNDAGTLAIKASIYQALGEPQMAAQTMGSLHPAPADWRSLRVLSYEAMLEHRPANAVTLLQTYLVNAEALGSRRGVMRRWLADALREDGHEAEARAAYALARQELESTLGSQPANPALIAELAVVTAELGERETAASLAEKCASLADAAHRESLRQDCALASARVKLAANDVAGARTTVDELLETTGGSPPLTPWQVATDPVWRPLAATASRSN